MVFYGPLKNINELGNACLSNNNKQYKCSAVKQAYIYLLVSGYTEPMTVIHFNYYKCYMNCGREKKLIKVDQRVDSCDLLWFLIMYDLDFCFHKKSFVS